MRALYLSTMRVLEPKDLEERRVHREKKHKTRKHKRKILPFILLIVAIYASVVMLIPTPALNSQANDIKLPPVTPVSMPWPNYGQAAVGAIGYGQLAKNGEEKPLPIASVAKLVTAVAVLKVRPIEPDTQGETLTMTAQDVALYRKYLSEGHSVVEVEAGEKLTEYQALQALLLPSANNIADALAIWAFGSMEEYLTFVNPLTRTLGMTNTNIDDASGFSPKTTSVASDLAKLAEITMNHPILSEIVSQAEAEIPVAGKVYNVNRLVGQNGVIGVKTGNTDEAGGCYVFAAKRKINESHEITVFGTVMGAPDLATAIDASIPLMNETFKNFKVLTPLNAQDVVGSIAQPGGQTVPVLVRQGTAIIVWSAQPITAQYKPLQLKSSVNMGDDVGTIELRTGDMIYKVPIMAGGKINAYSPMWRLKHAGGYL